MEDRINNEYLLKDKGVSNAIGTINLPRHRWYYYKEGFSPELVKTAIEDTGVTSKDLVLDPFNGSGTVTLTSAINGIPSLGFEVNPFTSFLAKAKTLSLSIKILNEQINRTIEICQKEQMQSYLEGFSTFTSHNRNIVGKESNWLFNTRVIRTFSAGLSLHRNKKGFANQLMKLALIIAAMENCNARKDGKCLRYKKSWNELGYGKDTFLESFRRIAGMIIDDIEQPVYVTPTIISGDSRKLIDKMERKFKLCITSPPYLNTFDYTDIYRPELFLGEFVTSRDQLYKLRFKTVRSHIQVRWKRAIEQNFGSMYQDVYGKIENNKDALMSPEILHMLAAYFEDLRNILKALRRKAQDDASLWFVISTSAYANQQVPVDLILADIATQVGWKLREVGVLRNIKKRKTIHSPDISMLRESVVILDAAPINN